MTTLDRPDSAMKLCEEAAGLIEVFVAGFQSAKTRCNYRTNLRAWFAWADVGGVDGLAAQRADVEAHVRHLEQCGYAPNTICQRVATLSSFYRRAAGEGHGAGNPVAGARRPRKPTESTASGLSRHELTDFLDAAEARGGDGYACACLLALNGLRVGELCATNIEDLGESTWHHTLTLRAATSKGHKPPVIALAPRTVQAISLSLAGRRCGPLLRNTRGRRMTSYNVAYLVAALCREIGVERRITPTACGTRRSRSPWMRASDCAMCRTSLATRIPRPPAAITRPQPAQPPRHLRHRPVPRRRQLNASPLTGLGRR